MISEEERLFALKPFFLFPNDLCVIKKTLFETEWTEKGKIFLCEKCEKIVVKVKSLVLVFRFGSRLRISPHNIYLTQIAFVHVIKETKHTNCSTNYEKLF